MNSLLRISIRRRPDYTGALAKVLDGLLLPALILDQAEHRFKIGALTIPFRETVRSSASENGMIFLSSGIAFYIMSSRETNRVLYSILLQKTHIWPRIVT